ncbi:MAG TPA: response regulator [Povalibacter sp.]|uniref:response regulator transcription factor n=1 Tax=Povalibacter sp. TaxID=1962978 RepID=UPI002BEEA406|nr:response regulator [Povalibacter sp.]HMN43350.1 response regulator [Povalibacter sp.]
MRFTQDGFVHIVDDDVSFANSIARMLWMTGIPVRCHESVAQYLAGDVSGPGCLLLDICLPGSSGFELYETLMSQHPRRPVIFLTGVDDVNLSVAAMRSGAVDFLLKPVEMPQLLASVRRALAIDLAQRIEQQRMADARSRLGMLSRIEIEVFRGVARGQRGKQVAHDLRLSTRTIKFHRERLMRKLQASSVADLVHLHRVLQQDEEARRQRSSQKRTWHASRLAHRWLLPSESGSPKRASWA